MWRGHTTGRRGVGAVIVAVAVAASLLATAIDIRAQGGYIVGWDSVVNGRPYTVVNDVSPTGVPAWLAETEARLREGARQAALSAHSATLTQAQWASESQVRKSVDGLCRKLAGTPEGERNNMLFWAACRLGELAAAGRITEEEAWSACADAAEQNGHMDWGEYGVRATFDSGFDRGFGGDR